jgi:hypothetical protein
MSSHKSDAAMPWHRQRDRVDCRVRLMTQRGGTEVFVCVGVDGCLRHACGLVTDTEGTARWSAVLRVAVRRDRLPTQV